MPPGQTHPPSQAPFACPEGYEIVILDLPDCIDSQGSGHFETEADEPAIMVIPPVGVSDFTLSISSVTGNPSIQLHGQGNHSQLIYDQESDKSIEIKFS